MPWDAAQPNLGFTSGSPWLPLGPEHGLLSVSEQDQKQMSVLNFFRLLMRERTSRPELRDGNLQLLDAPLPLLAFVRGGSILCVFNLGAEEVRWTAPNSRFLGFGTGGMIQDGAALTLGPFSAYFGTLEGL
jgi:alpha-glucosidase